MVFSGDGFSFPWWHGNYFGIHIHFPSESSVTCVPMAWARVASGLVKLQQHGRGIERETYKLPPRLFGVHDALESQAGTLRSSEINHLEEDHLTHTHASSHLKNEQ